MHNEICTPITHPKPKREKSKGFWLGTPLSMFFPSAPNSRSRMYESFHYEEFDDLLTTSKVLIPPEDCFKEGASFP